MKRILLLTIFGAFQAVGVYAQTERPVLRLILAPSQTEAARIRALLQAGESFEDLARKYSVDPSSSTGGYLGAVSVSDLRPEFKRALEGLKPGEVTGVIQVGDRFALLQVLSGEENWRLQDKAASEARQQGRLQEATRLFLAAVQEAESLGDGSIRVGQSLNGLAETYRLQENYSQAESVYRRSLGI